MTKTLTVIDDGSNERPNSPGFEGGCVIGYVVSQPPNAMQT